jgi:hypothetical protein
MALMFETVVTFLVHAFYVYAALGLLFAIVFALRGVQAVDRLAAGSGAGFRLLILPACVALWPLLLLRWLRANGEPPAERNPHR